MNTIILEQDANGDVPINIYSKLADNRIIIISDIITDKNAVDVSAALLMLDAEDNSKKISIFINAYGGEIRAVFMIYDIMKILSSPIEVICMGATMSECVLILAAGTPGMRYATPNAMIGPSQLIHEGSYYSDLTDAKITLDQIKLDNKKYMEALAKCIGKTYKVVMNDFDRKKFFTPKQALQYGIIDDIIKFAK